MTDSNKLDYLTEWGRKVIDKSKMPEDIKVALKDSNTEKGIEKADWEKLVSLLEDDNTIIQASVGTLKKAFQQRRIDILFEQKKQIRELFSKRFIELSKFSLYEKNCLCIKDCDWEKLLKEFEEWSEAQLNDRNK